MEASASPFVPLVIIYTDVTASFRVCLRCRQGQEIPYVRGLDTDQPLHLDFRFLHSRSHAHQVGWLRHCATRLQSVPSDFPSECNLYRYMYKLAPCSYDECILRSDTAFVSPFFIHTLYIRLSFDRFRPIWCLGRMSFISPFSSVLYGPIGFCAISI